MTGRDWHALAAKHGPQRAAYQRGEPPHLPPSTCARCGEALKPPAIVVTRTEALCPRCAGQVPDDRPDPPLYGGRRIEDLLAQSEGQCIRLRAWRDHLRKYGGQGLRGRATAEDLDRAYMVAYRRYWRRKRIWLTQ